ncbi:MAG: HD domain-containing protein [Desulfovibrio sp.]|nr:HD domain-containing protein [Desulfovibrio sp.]
MGEQNHSQKAQKSSSGLNFRILPRLSLSTKIVLLISLALLAFGLSAGFVTYKIYLNTSIEKSKSFAKGVASLAANIVAPEKVDEYLTLGEKAPDYLEIRQRLLSVIKNLTHIKYLYVYKIKEDGCHVVFDLDTQELQGEKPGTVIPFDEAFTQYLPTLLKGGEIEPVISDETYGWLLTVYVPVKDKNGNCCCYAAADISMDWLRVQSQSYLLKLFVIFLGVGLAVLLVSVLLLKKTLIAQLNSMAKATKDFDYNDKEGLTRSLSSIRSINIHSGDELENLYKAFVEMANNSVHYIQDIQSKNEAISQMQNALILTLADMVESRDQNTGEHIRKTAAYTKIIMEEMKRRHIYEDELTEQFMENVEHSAPLHDIGKINVPDAILNKPGKLTDEEFALMKSHTTTGGKIISHIIETVPESGYLYEAKNLATFHHEKWNGKGYPTGLSGLDIPLSARIMAVADVFDALVSTRSYKKGFPYEKAFAIIEEESGSHFDPKIVEAFFAVKDQAIRIADSFNKATQATNG